MSQTATVRRRDDLDEIEENETAPSAPVDAPGFREISELAHHLRMDRGRRFGSPDENRFRAKEELLQHQNA